MSTLCCSNCNEDLGKARENAQLAYCGNCGHQTLNMSGYKAKSQDFMSHEDFLGYEKQLRKAKEEQCKRQ